MNLKRVAKLSLLSLTLFGNFLCFSNITNAAGCGYICNDNPSGSQLDYCTKTRGAGSTLGSTLAPLVGGGTADCAGTPSCGMNTVAICCCAPKNSILTPVNGNTTDNTKPPLFTMPDLQVQIPGLAKLADINCPAEGDCSIPWLGQYISGLYSYALAIVGIIAAIVLMGGGLLWLVSGGDASRITQAKELIIGSITGLVILASSYIILLQINPNLVNLKSISVSSIKTIVLDLESTEPLPTDITTIASTLGVNCGVDSVSTIVQKSKGKVTYDNKNRGMLRSDGTIIYDCSGFAGFVIRCAFNKVTGANTEAIFQSQQAWDKDLNSLSPGDLVGWAPKNSPEKEGHTVIYLGNSLFGDCHGSTEGRKPGNCISSSMTLTYLLDSADRHSKGQLFLKRY